MIRPEVNGEHQDHLARLNLRTTLKDKVVAVHADIRGEFSFVDRIAVALYDERTRSLRTFLHSSGEHRPLENYEALITDAPGLLSLLESGRPRVLNDLSVLEPSDHPHSRALVEQGYGSSYTLPFYAQGVFEAFIFFNSFRKHVFTPRVVKTLDLYGHLMGNLILAEIQALRTLLAALRTVNHMVHLRDPETGGHLERMAYYARLIARDLAQQGIQDFSDEVIEHLFAFAPLHDIGKIAIPDRVLLKPTSLDPEEQELMRTHTTLGRKMVESIVANFGLESLEHVDILKAVAEYHHEMLDGSGYPSGLQGSAIPIFARIIAVADVFDALTSRRPYKYAWCVADALIHMGRLAGEKLDRDCVEALVRNREQVERILRAFPEELQVSD
ncbi:MAG: HD-GYP domain-containing protein [Acidobacteria bacterium]|nr:HD-GYP domain-containing protein [Acidobacteriota bacterium]